MKIKEGWNGKRKERRRTEAVGGRGRVSLARTNETGPGFRAVQLRLFSALVPPRRDDLRRTIFTFAVTTTVEGGPQGGKNGRSARKIA